MAGGLSAIAAVQDAVVERVADGAGLEIRRIPTAGAGLPEQAAEWRHRAAADRSAL